MTINVIETDGFLNVAVVGEMTIYNVSEQKNKLIEFLSSAIELQVDLSAVTEIDSAGLQLLLWLKQEASNLKLVNHSQAVVNVFQLLNLAMYFGDPIVLSSHWKTS
ncbi:MAG: STAS domain-containing protein [Methylovulum sp.]|nr:STAS domain-containing protein [Methylovulum sp.]MCF7999137.1 STAS domain-containing protein [Methylovulum sp.]